MLLDFYGMFDYASGDGDEYKYSSAEFSNLIHALTGNGVSYNFGNRFQSVSTSGLDITIGSGAVFIQGRYAYNTTSKTFSASAVAAGATRKDTLAAELDLVNRTIELKIIEGTAADFPTLSGSQIALYNLTISNSGGTSTITTADDVRSFIYTSSLYPSSQIIFSATEPAYVEGAIWLKPQA
jgi:hypothetical protein